MVTFRKRFDSVTVLYFPWAPCSWLISSLSGKRSIYQIVCTSLVYIPLQITPQISFLLLSDLALDTCWSVIVCLESLWWFKMGGGKLYLLADILKLGILNRPVVYDFIHPKKRTQKHDATTSMFYCFCDVFLAMQFIYLFLARQAYIFRTMVVQRFKSGFCRP